MSKIKSLSAERLNSVGQLLYGPLWKACVADALSVSRNSVSQWAAGNIIPRPRHTVAILALLAERETNCRDAQEAIHQDGKPSRRADRPTRPPRDRVVEDLVRTGVIDHPRRAPIASAARSWMVELADAIKLQATFQKDDMPRTPYKALDYRQYLALRAGFPENNVSTAYGIAFDLIE